MPVIKAVLFDKDGTLIDFDRTWDGVAKKLALEAAAGDATRASHLLAIGGYAGNGQGFLADSVLASGTNSQIVQLWYPDLDGKASRAMIAKFDSVCADHVFTGLVPLPGVTQVVALLHGAGFRLGIATNDSTLAAERTIATLKIEQHFEAVYGYDAVARPKPAPDSVLAFCELCQLRPSEVAVVGDNGHDLEMARQAGAGLAIAVLSGNGTRQSLLPLADMVLDSVRDLPAILLKSTRAK